MNFENGSCKNNPEAGKSKFAIKKPDYGSNVE